MCLITCEQEICRHEICQDVHLPLIGCRQEVRRQEMCQDTSLPLTRPDGKYSGLVGLPFQAAARSDSWPFSGNPETDMARETINLASLIKARFKTGFKL